MGRDVIRRFVVLSLSMGFCLVPLCCAAAGASAGGGGRRAPLPDSFADIAAPLLPAVVNIATTGSFRDDQDEEEGGGGPSPVPEPRGPKGSPFDKFFRNYMNRPPAEDGGGEGGRMQALGSGFIIDPSGVIVTNNHVIRQADQINITLQDNTVLRARVLGTDERTDMAVLKVDPPHPLAAVTFGDSDTARVGDWVLAVGNPFGLSGTVTSGIISSRGRNIDQGPYDNFIQTDAAINRGNSGGPLFNVHGEVIGINTAIFSTSGESIGIGFAIPSNEARGVIEQLWRAGHVTRGWLGIRIQNVTADIAEGLGLKNPRGALVAGVEKGGAADKAHLQAGDVIQFVNGRAVEGRSFPRLIAQAAVGSTLQLDVWRKGQVIHLPVSVMPMPGDAEDTDGRKPPAREAPPASKQKDEGALGFKAGDVDDLVRQKYNLPGAQKGVVVTGLTPGGAAQERGVRPGDIIVEVQQNPVTTVEDMRRELRKARQSGRKAVLLFIKGSDGERWIPLPVTQR